MANMAFDALRSLDYRGMTVDMNGPLTGEIVTRVRFDGVSQGKGATKNFITRRIGKLPFRFVITITAQFYQLITNIRSMYDPTMVQDPRDLASRGLLVDQNGNVVTDATRVPAPPTPPPSPAIRASPAPRCRRSRRRWRRTSACPSTPRASSSPMSPAARRPTTWACRRATSS
jgi:hypothetical protein